VTSTAVRSLPRDDVEQPTERSTEWLQFLMFAAFMAGGAVLMLLVVLLAT